MNGPEILTLALLAVAAGFNVATVVWMRQARRQWRAADLYRQSARAFRMGATDEARELRAQADRLHHGKRGRP